MLLSLYFAPAAIICLCLWLALAALNNFGVGVVGRRISSVILATVGLAPIPISYGIFIPNGVLVAVGDLPMLHQFRLVIITALSFLITAIVSSFLSYYLIQETSNEAQSGSRAWVIGITQLALFVAIIALYRGTTPDREIPPSIDKRLVESIYGEQLDRAEALGKIADAAQWRAAVTALDEMAQSEATILQLKISHKSFLAYQNNQTLNLGVWSSSGGCSGTDEKWKNDQMMRCTLKVVGVGKVETLRYLRTSGVKGNRIFIEVQIDYDELLKKID